MKKKKASMPDIFNYTDFRLFLRDCFEFKKSQNKHFTYRYFSMKAGYTSPSILKEILDGKKGIPARRIGIIAEIFGLNKKQTEFFEKLVHYNQAVDDIEKSRFFKEIIKLQRQPHSKKITEKEHSFYDKWYYSVVREIIALEDAENDPQWIAAKISPRITPEQAREAVEHLKKLEFIKENKTRKLVQDVPKISVDPDAYIESVKQYGRRMIELGWDAIERYDAQDREMSGIMMNMSRDCYYDVKMMVRKFKEDVLDYVSKHPEASNIVCRLNFELFPFNKDLEKKSRRNNNY